MGSEPLYVRLVYANPISYAVSGMTYNSTSLYAHVKNVGSSSARHVYIHYNPGGGWQDVEMARVVEYETHSLYKHDLPLSRAEFVLTYENDDGTFWDNNDWSNYRVQAWGESGVFVNGAVGRNVALGEAQINMHEDRGSGTVQYILKGTIYVQNLSFNKLVGFHINVGGLWIDLYASYSRSFWPGGGKIESWTFGEYGKLIMSHPIITPPHPFPHFQFAVFYHNLDWGASYWDNNFWQDYFLKQNNNKIT